MNPLEEFQTIMSNVPEAIGLLVTMLAGAVPFIEGEGAATLAIVSGINPILAGIAAAFGNFACVVALVYLSAGARNMVVTRKSNGGASPENSTEPGAVENTEGDVNPRKAARKAKFTAALSKYGVPGVSLLGPLLLPTMFTASMLAAAGVKKGRVIFWQGIAILGWTTLFVLLLGGLLGAL